VKHFRLASAILVGALGIGLVGCHRGPELHVTAAAPAALDGGWTTASSSDNAVSVGIPPGWKAGVDTPGSGLADMASKLGGSSADGQPPADPAFNAQMQDMARQMDEKDKEAEAKALAGLAKKVIVINAINGSKPTPGEDRTHFYVKVSHGSGSISKDQAIDTEKNHYAYPPKPTEVKLPIGMALKFSADDALRDGMTLHQISYVVIDGSDYYALRFVTEEDVSAIQQIADQVANTLRIKPSK